MDPIYSTRHGTDVFHDQTRCTEANNIEARYLRSGVLAPAATVAAAIAKLSAWPRDTKT